MITWYTSTAWHQWWMTNVWTPTYSKLTSAVYGIPAGLLVVGQEASKFANDSTITNYLGQMNVPNWLPMGLAGIALVHYVASGHDA